MLNDDLIAEWHPTKNGDLDPKSLTHGSSKKVWWLCKKGHEWEAIVFNRTREKKPSGCPYCSGKAACSDNCLATLRPDLAKEWHTDRNGKLTPNDVTISSHKMAWWLCEKEHEWESRIADRGKWGCPYCSGQRVCKDNCLHTLRPDIAEEWDYADNYPLKPEDVTHGSKKSVWWICKKNHKWRASINDRTSGYGCPYCSSKKVCEDNCLATLRPDIASEWHTGRNGKLTPNDVTVNSSKKVWWICKRGHEWVSTVADRGKGGCPYCSGRRVCNDNCLAILMPDIAKQWHPDKNGKLTSRDVVLGSGKVVWWLCEKGHSWKAKVYSRINGSGCPYCAGQKVCEENSLAYMEHGLVTEWNYNKNGALTPENFTVFSRKKVWWVCDKGHEWQSVIANRTKNRNMCPQCSNGPVSKISQEWLDLLGVPVENREVLLPDLKIRVDAFVPETNTVYEFFGDYWHGNPARFDRNEEHPVCGKTFGQLYDETKARISRLVGTGYKVVYIWESDFNNEKEDTLRCLK